MDYKYRRFQLFGKRLNVPRYVLRSIYDEKLNLEDMIKYELYDKIPLSCLNDRDKQIIEKFGIDKMKNLDYELLQKRISYSRKIIDYISLLETISPNVQDINMELYELVKNQIRPYKYTEKMKKIYQDRIIDISKYQHDVGLQYLIEKFNMGELSLPEIINNWDLFKEKDLSFCLQMDYNNKFNISDNDLKEFMNDFNLLKDVLTENTDVYQFLGELKEKTTEMEKQEYLKKFTDSILEKQLNLSNEQYIELFNYSSLEECLKKISEYKCGRVVKELENLPKDYIFNTQFPFSILLNEDVLTFIGIYGLKNVVDFDNECGQFFSKNNCEMLKSMEKLYLHYGGYAYISSEKKIFFSNNYKNGDVLYTNAEGVYTKDGFYEAMRRMIIYGPTDENYKNSAPDYRDMTGEFRTRNKELFISEEAPEELQKLFYTKSITPEIIVEHPEFISYLEGKDLGSCFKSRLIRVNQIDKTYNYVNLYNFISSKTNFNETLKMITEYSGIFNVIFDRRLSLISDYDTELSQEDDINEIQTKIIKSFEKIMIKTRMEYPKDIPQSLIDNYPSLFLSRDAPLELQKVFYNRSINQDFILSNPNYRNYLKNINLEVIYKYLPTQNIDENNKYTGSINLISAIKQTFGTEDSFDLMLLYGKYIESVFNTKETQVFRYSSTFSKDDFLDALDAKILHAIIDGKIKYDENIPSHFKNNNPTLFLNQNVPQDIKNKFYNREFTLKDFASNPDLLEIFGDTNVVCGFPENMAWMIPLFNDSNNLKTANINRLKLIVEYSKIKDVKLQDAFKEYIIGFENDIDMEKIEYVSEVLTRLTLSNSSEIFTFRKELASQILKSTNPLGNLSKIEEVFIKNNLPTVGKVYSCFDILHPDFSGFELYNTISPVLIKSSTMSKKIIVFSDLVKATFGSNNRTVNNYLTNIETGNKLYESIKKGLIQYDDLNQIEQNVLITFSKHLETLYNNTMKAKKESETFLPTGNVFQDILELSKKISPDGTLDYNLEDRIIRMFCGFAGIDTLEQAKNYINTKIKNADARNRETAKTEMILEKGDFIKGIGGLEYLGDILQNGSVSKEYLGSSATSDSTPLDTDISMIMSSDGTIEDKINLTAAKDYGPIWFVLKNDERFITTRTSNETLDTKKDMTKMEAFYTGVLGEGHYGIRTGFASSEINYIVMENYDPRVGLEIAMNGFYIPVANKDGKIIFTPNDYDKLREKMNGLSYYGINNYVVDQSIHRKSSEILEIVENLQKTKDETIKKAELIKEKIRTGLKERGLTLNDVIDLNLDSVTLFNTGSTGRTTNIPGDGDFDYTMQIDRNIYSSDDQKGKLIEHLVSALCDGSPDNYSYAVVGGDIRELKTKVVDEQGIEHQVEIDITFTQKTDKTEYASDVCVTDRLNNISSEDEKNLVIANIILAKQFLKSIEAYKPARKFPDQGGLGGIGVENWILQNGGTLYSAAKSFIEIANECSSFEEFKSKYTLPNFGYNHMADKKGFYPHDDYIENMNEVGYKKMKNALNIYVSKCNANIDNPVVETIDEIQNNQKSGVDSLLPTQPTK